MRGRTSLRAAAVLMAGLISASLVAPGLASAQTDQASCVSGGGSWVAATGDCVAGAGGATTGSAGTGSSTGAADTGAGSTTGTTGGTTGSTPSTGTTTTPPAAGGTATTGAAATPGDPAGTGTAGTTTGTATGTPGAAATTQAVDSTAPSSTNEKAAETGAASIKAAVADITEDGGPAALPTDLPVPVVLPDLGFDVPTSIPDGGFTNPQQACAYFGSLVTVPAGDDPTGLGSQIGTFCGALPTSFTDGLGSVTGLVDQLTDLLKKLAASLPKPPSNIPSTPPQGTPDHFKGWWNSHHDIDCGDVSYDEAQAILRLDRHDPFNLDGDDDGEACERNSKYVECWDGHDHEVVKTVEYEGYPVGGVSTGDSDPATDAAPVAASALGLVMTAGLASVTGARHRRDDDADEGDDADDRDVARAA